MTGTFFSLIPPLVAIVMAIVTRRVLLSLGLGIIFSALFIANFNLTETFLVIWAALKGIFIEDGGLNTWNIYILLFLLILGVITAFITMTGGSQAFGDWAMKRVKTKAGAQLVAAILGIIIFIDDYFNALAVGQVSRPITDKQKVSRAKLAYIIDSTSAPICVVAPISSWGAVIIGLISTELVLYGVTDVSALSAFLQIVPMNFYVWATLLLVFFTAVRGINLGRMKEHEERAEKTGQLFDETKEIPGELKEELPMSKQGSVGDLVWPILTLIIAVVGLMMWTGYREVGDDVSIFNLMAIFEEADVSVGLFYGGLIALAISVVLFFRQVSKGAISSNLLGRGFKNGTLSMLPAVYILIFAWMIGSLISDLATGDYLASLVEQSNLSMAFIPALLFIIASFMAFATGTSWGSFGILIPIAGSIAGATDIDLLLPSIAAVLAGAVFGDHASPISDTTILSSTGAGSNHIDHVVTQLPYALTSAIVSIIGYLVLGFTGSTLIGLTTVIVLMLIIATIFGKKLGSTQSTS